MQEEDVTKLTDEELLAKANGQEPEEPEKEVAEPADSEEKPSEEETSEEAPDEPEQPEQVEPEVTEEEPEAEQPTEEQKPPSRRETLRIQQILAKRERAQSPSQPVQQSPLNYGEALDADPEVIRQLEADRQAAGAASYNQGLEQAKSIQFHTRLEVDAPKVESKYKFLDKSSDEFDPVRADAINQLYLDNVGFVPGNPQAGTPDYVQNPNIRYSEFVEAQMEFAEALMADRERASVKNITRQAAQTGLRPDGSSAKSLNLNKAPEDMTDEELHTYLKRQGVPVPKKR